MKKGLNSNALKTIAVIAMTIDHITSHVCPNYPHELLPVLLRIIGRLTCPIMCYCIAEGYHYTKNIRKYTFRLFLFAFISHFAYVFASADFVDWKSFIPFYYGKVLNQTSVIWPLAWGLVMLRVVNSEKIKKQYVKVLLVLLICVITFPSNWSCIASLVILAFGTNRGNLKAQAKWLVIYAAMYSAVYCFALDWVYGLVQMGVVLAIPLFKLYNGERGKNPRVNKFMKWFFYIYYPLHLAVIGLIQYAI